MKSYILLVLILCFLFQPKPCISQVTKNVNSLYGVFDGRTPCRDLANQLNEKVQAECIKIKWRLKLYIDSITGNASTYELLGFVYKKGNPRLGRWQITKGTKANPEAIIFQLDQEGREPLFVQKGDDNILFFLDKNKNLMVGNIDFSYTLNRVDKNFRCKGSAVTIGCKKISSPDNFSLLLLQVLH